MDVDSDEDPSIERTRIDERDIRDDEADGTAGPTAGAIMETHMVPYSSPSHPPVAAREWRRGKPPPPFEHDGRPAVENNNPLIRSTLNPKQPSLPLRAIDALSHAKLRAYFARAPPKLRRSSPEGFGGAGEAEDDRAESGHHPGRPERKSGPPGASEARKPPPPHPLDSTLGCLR